MDPKVQATEQGVDAPADAPITKATLVASDVSPVTATPSPGNDDAPGPLASDQGADTAPGDAAASHAGTSATTDARPARLGEPESDSDSDSSEPPPGLIGKLRSALLAPIVVPLKTAWRLVPNGLKTSWLVTTVVDTVNLVRHNRVMGIAAEVAFWAVLSVTPLLLVSASALGWIDTLFGFEVADDAREGLSRAVNELLGISGSAVDAVDDLFDNPDPARLTFGVLTSIYASSRGFTSLIGGLDHITGRDKRRNWFTTRVAGFTAALLSVPALVALLVMVSVGRTGFGLPQPWSDIAAAATWPVIAIGLTAFALWLLHSSPAERTPIIHDLLGAVVAVAIWLGGSWITARYLGAAGGSDVLGILGGSVGLLIWLYIMASGILIGAQVNVAIAERDRATANAHSAQLS